MSLALSGRRILITGIANEQSLALAVAEELQAEGAELVCAGLGWTRHNKTVSKTGMEFLEESQRVFQEAVRNRLGQDTPVVIFDAGIDESLEDAANELLDSRLQLDGVLHAIALDRTIRGGEVKPMLEVSREEFLGCMSISAYSLIGLMRALSDRELLNTGASIVSLSYLGADRITSHPYRNIGVAKAALERITKELAFELGHANEIRVNAIRFSPYAESRAGGAIPDLVRAVEDAAHRAPLGNATPKALGQEVAHLMRSDVMATGEIRHLDGGYQMLAGSSGEPG